MIKVSADSVSGGNPLFGSQMTIFLLCPHMGEGARDLQGFLCKGTNPTHEDTTTMIEGLSSKYQHTGAGGWSGFQHVEFGGVYNTYLAEIQLYWVHPISLISPSNNTIKEINGVNLAWLVLGEPPRA